MQNRAIHPDRYCVHQVTLMEQCDFRESLEALSRHGIHRTAVWKDKLDELSLSDARHQLDDNGNFLATLCRLHQVIHQDRVFPYPVQRLLYYQYIGVPCGTSQQVSNRRK